MGCLHVSRDWDLTNFMINYNAHSYFLTNLQAEQPTLVLKWCLRKSAMDEYLSNIISFQCIENVNAIHAVCIKKGPLVNCDFYQSILSWKLLWYAFIHI